MQKIIVVDRNRLLRDMLTKAIDTQDNLDIVKILHSNEFLYDHVQNQMIDWVVISLPDGQKDLPRAVKDILVNYPDVGVLIVSPDGRHVRVKWLEVHERNLDGIGLDNLMKLLSQNFTSGQKDNSNSEKQNHN